MPRKNAPGCPCGCGPVTVCVQVCSPAIAVVGATVNILDDGQLVYSCTTGSSGCCTVPLTGFFTLQVVVSGQVAYEATVRLSGTVVISIPTTGLVCCGGYAIPQSLTLTDALGSLDFFYSASYTYPVWTGGRAVTALSCSVTTPGNNCVAAAPSEGPVRVCYQMICYAGQQPTFYVQRSWSWVYEQGTQTPIYFQDSSSIVAGQPCVTAPPASCGSPHTDTSIFSANPSSTNPFMLTGSPVQTIGNFTPDPVGGSVAIS